jgi:hypothetical protein
MWSGVLGPSLDGHGVVFPGIPQMNVDLVVRGFARLD